MFVRRPQKKRHFHFMPKIKRKERVHDKPAFTDDESVLYCGIEGNLSPILAKLSPEQKGRRYKLTR